MPLKLLLFIFLYTFSHVMVSQDNSAPVAAYTFNDGTANDEAGTLHAKAVGVSFVSDRFGNPGYACYVHGNPGSYLNLGTSPSLKPYKASISIWVNIDIAMLSGKGLKVNPIIITKNSAEDDFNEAYTIEYDYDLNKIVVGTTNSESSQLTLHTIDTFAIHKWHHIVLTYDDQFSCLYIDGKQEIKMAKNFRTHFLDSDSVLVGSMVSLKNNRYLCGSIDDIRIYNKVISPEEVFELYTEPDPNRNSIYLKWFLRLIVCVVVLIACCCQVDNHGMVR